MPTRNRVPAIAVISAAAPVGTVVQTLADVTSVSGAVIPNSSSGSITRTLADVTSSTAAVVANGPTGSIVRTLDGVTVSSTGAVVATVGASGTEPPTLRISIPASGTTSDAATIPMALNLAGIDVPTMTGTSMTFLGSIDGTNYFALYEGTTLYSVASPSGRYIALDPAVVSTAKFLRVVSSSTEPSARPLTLVLRK